MSGPPVHAFPMLVEQAKDLAEDEEDAWAAVYKPMGEPFGAVVTRDGETIERLSRRFSGSEYRNEKFEAVEE